MWDLKTYKIKVDLPGHTDEVYCVDFVADKIVSGGQDRTVKMWVLVVYQLKWFIRNLFLQLEVLKSVYFSTALIGVVYLIMYSELSRRYLVIPHGTRGNAWVSRHHIRKFMPFERWPMQCRIQIKRIRVIKMELRQPAHIQYQVSHPFDYINPCVGCLRVYLHLESSCQNKEYSPDHLEHLSAGTGAFLLQPWTPWSSFLAIVKIADMPITGGWKHSIRFLLLRMSPFFFHRDVFITIKNSKAIMINNMKNSVHCEWSTKTALSLAPVSEPIHIESLRYFPIS